MSPLDEMLHELREIYNPNSEAAKALAKSMQNHPTAFAAHRTAADATVVPISAHPRYRARRVVRDQLGLGDRG